MNKAKSIETTRQLIARSSIMSIAEIGHPAGRITIEATAKRSGLSASTISSQAGGSESFRLLMYAELLTQIDKDPGDHTWAVLHSCLLAERSAKDAFIDVMVARMFELSLSRTLALSIGVYDQTIIDELRGPIQWHMAGLADGIRPLLESAAASKGADIRAHLSTETGRVAIGLVLMAGALNLRAHPRQSEADAGFEERVLAETIWNLDQIDQELPPMPNPPKPYSQPRSLQDAIGAAIGLMLDNEFTLTSPVSVADACRNAGVGVSSFYRVFSSVEDFSAEVLAISLAKSFRSSGDGFFNHLDEETFAELSASEDPYSVLISSYLDSVETSDKNLDITVWSWIDCPAISRQVLRSLSSNAESRGQVYYMMSQGLKREFKPGWDGEKLAAIHMSIATITELHQRLYHESDIGPIRDIAKQLFHKTLVSCMA